VRRLEHEVDDETAPQLRADHLCLLTISRRKPTSRSVIPPFDKPDNRQNPGDYRYIGVSHTLFPAVSLRAEVRSRRLVTANAGRRTPSRPRPTPMYARAPR
jgi:hypothetical protein